MPKKNKKTILVVEDDLDMLEQMSIYLQAHDYSVLKATSQKEGEELVKKNNFDAAVLDLMMENQDSGFVLSYKIKKIDEKKPVIIVTSVSNKTGLYFDKSEDSGSWIKADVIIQKEVRFEQVKSELDRLIAMRS